MSLVGFKFTGALVHEMLARSIATKNPKIETARAAVFKYRGIVMIIGEEGIMIWLINSPAIMLPIAKRLIGLTIVGLFSLEQMTGLYRGCFMDAKKIIRKL